MLIIELKISENFDLFIFETKSKKKSQKLNQKPRQPLELITQPRKRELRTTIAIPNNQWHIVKDQVSLDTIGEPADALTPF